MRGALRQILQTYSPLSVRVLRLYLGGQWVSLVGTWMQNAAQAWLVWELTHSAAALGMIGMLNLIPFLFLGPFGGVIADRADRRKLLISMQVASMLLAFILAALVGTHTVEVWHVYLLAFILGSVEAIGIPTQQAFLSDIAGGASMRRVVVINNSIFQISRMVGPPLASLVTRWVGMASAFWINGLSFLAVIFSLRQIQILRAERGTHSPGLHDFMEGIRYLRGTILLQYLFVFTLFMTLFGFSSFQILPAFAASSLHGDFSTYGSMMGVSGLGALFGVMILVPQSHRTEKIGFVLSSACAFSGICFASLSLTHSIPVALSLIFLGSLTFPVVMVNVNGIVQMITPAQFRARMISLWLVLGFGIQPFASLLVGYYANLYGPSAALGLNGLLMALGAALMMIGRPQFRKWSLEVT
jgi:MFS family permease